MNVGKLEKIIFTIFASITIGSILSTMFIYLISFLDVYYGIELTFTFRPLVEEFAKVSFLAIMHFSPLFGLALGTISGLIFGIIESMFRLVIDGCWGYPALIMHTFTTAISVGFMGLMKTERVRSWGKARYVIYVVYMIFVPVMIHITFNSIYDIETVCESDRQTAKALSDMFGWFVQFFTF